MPFAMEQLSQGLTVLGSLPPQSLAAGTDNSITNIDMRNVQRIMWIIDVGSVGGAGTVDFRSQRLPGAPTKT
jgi:hypothetical protein